MSEGGVALAPEKLGRPLPDDGGRPPLGECLRPAAPVLDDASGPASLCGAAPRCAAPRAAPRRRPRTRSGWTLAPRTRACAARTRRRCWTASSRTRSTPPAPSTRRCPPPHPTPAPLRAPRRARSHSDTDPPTPPRGRARQGRLLAFVRTAGPAQRGRQALKRAGTHAHAQARTRAHACARRLPPALTGGCVRGLGRGVARPPRAHGPRRGGSGLRARD